jgi:phage shock protein A
VWRLPVSLHAGETRMVAVHVDRITFEATTLTEDDGVLAQVLNQQALGQLARTALRRIADLRAALSAREAERDHTRAQLDEIERDEDRIRRNLAALPPTDALHGKLVRALDADEDRIASVTAGIAQAETAMTQARAALEQAVQTLRL